MLYKATYNKKCSSCSDTQGSLFLYNRRQSQQHKKMCHPLRIIHGNVTVEEIAAIKSKN